MEFFGDFCGHECFPDDILFSPSMSTAIARIYTQEGFVVAADGRKLDGKTGRIADDEVQKIFPLRHEAGEVACSIAGVAQIVSELGMFDFGVEAGRAALAIARAGVKNPDDYSELLRIRMCQMLEVFNPASLNSFTEAQTHIYLDGYLLGRPMRRKITLTYQTNKIESAISAEDLFPGKTRVYGSELIWAFLFATTPHSYLSSYRQVCQMPRPTTVEQATRVALNVIRAHCDPQAMSIDAHGCAAIGGRIHIAKVTQPDGFEWIQDFHPIPAK